MKRVSKWFWAQMNLIVGALIGLLGCSCKKAVSEGESNRPIMCMYGVPTATYHIKGQVTDVDLQPIAQAQVTIKRNNQVSMGQMQTNQKGEYQLDYEGFPTDTLRVIVQSPDLSSSPDSILVPTREGEDSAGFDMGETSYQVDITLK